MSDDEDMKEAPQTRNHQPWERTENLSQEEVNGFRRANGLEPIDFSAFPCPCTKRDHHHPR